MTFDGDGMYLFHWQKGAVPTSRSKSKAGKPHSEVRYGIVGMMMGNGASWAIFSPWLLMIVMQLK